MMQFSAKSSFNKFCEVDDDSKNIVCTFNKEQVELNKPIFTGAAILDFSKMLMFRFHHDIAKAKYKDKAKLLFTDTDSLCYSIEFEDVYKDLQVDLGKHFDFSAYPKDHPLYNINNKKVPGYFKDEAVGPDKTKNIKFQTISEFCSLRSKMYAYSLGGKNKFTAKGIKNALLKRN
jgi:hypothetical protein